MKICLIVCALCSLAFRPLANACGSVPSDLLPGSSYCLDTVHSVSDKRREVFSDDRPSILLQAFLNGDQIRDQNRYAKVSIQRKQRSLDGFRRRTHLHDEICFRKRLTVGKRDVNCQNRSKSVSMTLRLGHGVLIRSFLTNWKTICRF